MSKTQIKHKTTLIYFIYKFIDDRPFLKFNKSQEELIVIVLAKDANTLKHLATALHHLYLVLNSETSRRSLSGPEFRKHLSIFFWS
jgi:hypothetical protein